MPHQSEARTASARTASLSEAADRIMADPALAIADTAASFQPAGSAREAKAEFNRLAQESLDRMMTAQRALASAATEASQRLARLSADAVTDGFDHAEALARARSAGDLVILQLAFWRRSGDRALDETKALGDIALRTAELTLVPWAAAIDRAADTQG